MNSDLRGRTLSILGCCARNGVLRAAGALASVVLLNWIGFAILPTSGEAATLDKQKLEKSLASSALTEEQKIIHVLNRLGYGPRPGEVERVKSMGVGAYIAQQLNPESIDDSAIERRLAHLETLNKSASELAEYLPDPQANRRLQEKKDSEPPGKAPESDENMRRAQQGLRKVAVELQQAKILRATYSERQLQEVMTDFWFNHFNVFIGKGADRILTPEYEREAIRPNALGKFRDLLEKTAKSPAMLFYLDNWMSVDPNAQFPERRFVQRPRAQMDPDREAPQSAIARRPRGLNENYARELLELHSMGVDGGYSQKDVTEVARCFTGWTIRNPRRGGEFQFVGFLHDNGEKTVLGRKIPAGGGIKDGEMVLDMLSKHPSTARFLSTKLCRRFVSDNPPNSIVRRCAEVFFKTDGDIRQVLATIFTSPEFYSKDAHRAKIKKPFDLVVSSLRATRAETRVPPRILMSLRSMGEMLYGCQPPTGYADTADAWINTGALLERINFATALAASAIPGTEVEPHSLADLRGGTEEIVASMARALLSQKPKKEFVEAIVKQIETSERGIRRPTEREIAKVAGLILGSPEFQKR